MNFRTKIIQGTVRLYWVFVPAQYNPTEPASVLVFQHGGALLPKALRWLWE